MHMKVAIYCRLSEEDKNKQVSSDDSESIQNQKSMLIQYALDREWEVYNIYSDDDYAGADRNRPQFNKLLDDAKNKKFDIVLCKTQSRFTRELELVEKYIHGLFPIWHIRFISIVDNADTEIKGNKKSRQINGLVNEWYLEDMSENIKSVLTNRRENGFHIGAFALYGYKKDPNHKGHLIIDEESANVVREVFTLYSQGYGKTAIARLLNDRGIPNPTEYKRLQGLRYKEAKNINSTLWRYYTISAMLTNEMYIGNMVQGKYGSVSYKTKQNKPIPKADWIRVEGTHEAIIDTDLWKRVQTMLAQKTKPFSGGTIGLFAGKVRCMHCGYIMKSSKNHDKHYLKCSSRYAAPDACIGSFISVAKLEMVVLIEIDRMANQYLNRNMLLEKIQLKDDLKQKRDKLVSDITRYQAKINEYAKGLRELYLDKVRGIVSESDYIALSNDFSHEKKRLEELVISTSEMIDKVDNRIESADERRQIISEYTNLTELNRETVEKLIDYIVVGKRFKGMKQPIEIHWNF